MKSLGPVLKLAILGVLVNVSIGFATQVIIDNSSFEALSSAGLPYGCGSSCSFSEYDSIPDWTVTGNGEYGQMQPGSAQGNDLYFNTVPDGNTVAFSFGPSLSQTVDTTVQTGTAYTLTVSLGARNYMGFGGGADLLVNGVTYQATGTQPAPGQWSTYTVTYVGLAVDMGDTITVQLTDPNGGVADFDNVQLAELQGVDPTGIPESGLTGSAGAALFCAFLAYKRKFILSA